MLIQNESYDDKIMRLRYEMLLMHSKTGQALGLDKAENFDAAIDEALKPEAFRIEETPNTETQRRPVPPRQVSTGRGTLMSDVDALLSARARSLRGNIPVSPAPDNTAERDTVIAEAAQRYAQAMDVSGSHDTVFAAPA